MGIFDNLKFAVDPNKVIKQYHDLINMGIKANYDADKIPNIIDYYSELYPDYNVVIEDVQETKDRKPLSMRLAFTHLKSGFTTGITIDFRKAFNIV